VHTQSIERWLHDHTFGQHKRKSGERRTLVVIAITAAMMTVEIAAGIVFGSMALLADGLHMGSHALALAISAFAYYFTRRHARDPRFNFGTGKVNSLAAFASAVLLVVFALVMAWESVRRFVSPVEIEFDQAILVAVLGLIVNGACLVVLGGHGRRHKQHSHGLEHGTAHTHEAPHATHHDMRHRDHTLWSAYLHVLADALTSFLAIFALLAGKYFGQTWLDPFMGVVGAALIVRWSWGLIGSSGHVLLDMQAPDALRGAIREAIENEGDNRISDLHVWAVGPGIYAAEIALVTSSPGEADHYWRLLPEELNLVHMTVEVHACPSPAVT
jgi:cation diffusion facilitator family transporter